MEKNVESSPLRPKEYYRERIIELLKKVKDEGTLRYLYTFLTLFLEKWG